MPRSKSPRRSRPKRHKRRKIIRRPRSRSSSKSSVEERRRSRSRSRSSRTSRSRSRSKDSVTSLTDYVTSFANSKGMTLQEFHEFLMNVNFYKEKNPEYDTKGLHNPMIIGNYVVRAVGHRTNLLLQVRKKLESYTSKEMEAMADVSNDNYMDKNNRDKYTTIDMLSDY